MRSKAEVEQLLAAQEYQKLSIEDQVTANGILCEQAGITPRPGAFLFLKARQGGRMVAYPSKGTTDAIAQTQKLSRRIVSTSIVSGIYVVTAEVQGEDGRVEQSSGTCAISGSHSELADEMMKAETKAKRRATLAYLGVNMNDESEWEGPVERGQFQPVAAPAPQPPHQTDTAEEEKRQARKQFWIASGRIGISFESMHALNKVKNWLANCLDLPSVPAALTIPMYETASQAILPYVNICDALGIKQEQAERSATAWAQATLGKQRGIEAAWQVKGSEWPAICAKMHKEWAFGEETHEDEEPRDPGVGPVEQGAAADPEAAAVAIAPAKAG